ncbi:putative rRNA methylase [Scopulibacillus darangshiensis]|uniref:Putative rRNA methylase n=1 Tax=Scopulibacillus darangshiensis TaxID=442528 RepID=A0A4R2NX84_9BACL|nr:class I SAM-dependent methyltransferase [Scopulibacillus darangshiensis]TCP26642.1 putative rRNA methylase [Scopulibacillus darangshiensis]
MKGVIEFAHELLKEILLEGDLAVDGTLGNGHDTLFLAKAVSPSGKVYGFDIQETAIKRTRERLDATGKSDDSVTLIHASHHRLSDYVPPHGIKAAIFNLGYLPRGNKKIVTKHETTIAALTALQPRMEIRGRIAVVVYPGHPEGKDEADVLIPYFKNIDQTKWDVTKYEMLNQVNDPPFLIVMEKRQGS